MVNNVQAQPDVTLAITPSCPHCPGMMEMLGQLVKNASIGSLHIINIASQADFANIHEIRSVPWLKIGPFILQGVHTQQEIKQWLDRWHSETGIEDYFSELLSNGELHVVNQAIRFSPDIIKRLVHLISSDETNINVRLGMAAILEDMAGQAILESLLDDLSQLLKHHSSRVRGDAAHFLSFIHSPMALTVLRSAQDDPDAEVKEIIMESIESLEAVY